MADLSSTLVNDVVPELVIQSTIHKRSGPPRPSAVPIPN